jgi:hypothetical protein
MFAIVNIKYVSIEVRLTETRGKRRRKLETK